MNVEIKDKSLLSCWPDGFSRYFVVSRILAAIFKNQPTTVLDVGGDSKWMYLFLKDSGLNFKLTIVDTRLPDFKNQEVNYVKKDFFKLEREAFQADAVINTDVLEHIPQDQKVPFIDQCIDFTKSVAIFQAPQDDELVTTAEQTINRLSKKITGKEQRWLKEHFIYGKPSAELIRQTIGRHSHPFIELNTNNLDSWLLSFAANLVNQQSSNIPNMDELNRFYNSNIAGLGDFSDKAYRKIFIVFKAEALYKASRPAIEAIFKASQNHKSDFTSSIVEALALKIHGQKVTIEKNEKRLSVVKKELDLQSGELLARAEQIKRLQTQSAQRADQIKNLETELVKIFSKRWFRYINKLGSLLRRPRN